MKYNRLSFEWTAPGTRWVILGFAGLLALVLTSCKPAAPEPKSFPVTPTSAAKPLRVGAYYWPGQYWADIAHAKGWFREAGVNVEWVDTNTNYFGSFDELVAGKLDAVEFYFFDFVAYVAKGHDLVGVLVADYSHGAESLVARPEFSRLADLKGRRIALSKGTYLEFLLTLAAQREGLRVSDFVLVDVPGERAHEELIAGRADAALTWEPLSTAGLEAVKGRKLFDTSQIPGVCGALYVFRREFVREREADVRAFVRAWHRTNQFLKEQPNEAFRVVAEVNRKPLADVQAFTRIDRALGLRENLVAISFTTGYDSVHGALRRINDFLIERGLTTNRVDTAKLIDARFLRELQ